MEALSTLFLLIAIVFLLYNLVINLTNLSKIVEYCFDKGSLDHYWDLFYEACVNKRALYSTIAIGIIGFIVFIFIAPFVIIKGMIAGKKLDQDINSGAQFKYENYNLVDKSFTFSNIDELGIDPFEMTVTGHISIDLPFLMSYIQQKCDDKKCRLN